MIAFLSKKSLRHDRRLRKGARPDVCSIFEPPEPTEADRGQEPNAEYPQGWTALLTDEPGLFYATQAKAMEGANANQVQEVGDFRLEIRHDAPRPSGRARVRINSLDYEIVGIRDSSYSIAMIIDLKRVK